MISCLIRTRKWQNETSMALRFTTSYLEDSLSLFRYYKDLAERAMAQLTDEELLEALDSESNSIAIIVKHMWAICCRGGGIF